jgi:hypothetical protein
MTRTCRTCSRVNPADASYCYHDGNVLDGQSGKQGPLNAGMQPFPSPFVFPSGRVCQNFDQLALACEQGWAEALFLLKEGYLENFLSSLGRTDLAVAARSTAQCADPDQGLDQFLDRLPSQVLEPPRLQVQPREINLGELRVGHDEHLELHLANQGMRLLQGSIRCVDCFWLALGQAPGQQRRLFETRTELAIPLHVRGNQLRAGIKPLEGTLVIESNGGDATVRVRASVPLVPFPEGVLHGATTPRQLAQKAKKAPKEAAVLFEQDRVANWYRQNGWSYPVQGPTASGLAAVQQFFEALGLTTAPYVALATQRVNFAGEIGARLEYTLKVKTPENRPIYAWATSDQAWLQIGRPRLKGRVAAIPLVVPRVPDCPGHILRAQVLVQANGQQRFTVPVLLAVAGDPQQIPSVLEIIDEVLPAEAPGTAALPESEGRANGVRSRPGAASRQQQPGGSR